MDKNYIYYILKIGDLMYYKSSERISMMGKRQSKFPIMEKFDFKNESKDYIQKSEFWSTYYRHNNYFYKHNKELLQTVRKDKAKKGFEKIITNEKSSTNDKDLLKKLFSASGLLSVWGVRSVSLNDIIRYMIFLKFDLDVINRICDEITNNYNTNMDKKLAYKVFRETEDEFSFRNYVEVEAKKSVEHKREGGVGDIIFCFGKVLGYLEPKDQLEMLLCNKECYSGLKQSYLDHTLTHYRLEQDTRVKIWWQHVPDVNNHTHIF